MRRAWLLLALSGLAPGCGAVLDLEGARELVRGATPPAAPLVREEPPAELAAPERMRASSGEMRAVPLKWDPVLAGDVAGYAVERSLRRKGDFQRIGITRDRFETAFVDRGTDLAPKAAAAGGGNHLGDGAAYHYRVRAFDGSGSLSRERSEVVSATTAAPPPRPLGVRSYSHQPRKIALSWRAQTDPTVAGYVVYRSPSLHGEYLPVARLDDRHATSWVDQGLEPLRVFYYRIASLNAAGGEGVPTRAVRGVTKPEPLPPAAVRVGTESVGAVRIAWDPNVEANVAGYRVLRTRGESGPEELVAEVGPQEHSALDRAVAPGEVVSYRVVAVDRDGLASDPSDAVVATAVGYDLRAAPVASGVQLRWSEPANGDYSGAKVLREGRFGLGEIAHVEGSEFLDRSVRPGQRYRYSVTPLRADGSEAPRSEVVEVAVPAQP